jgi:hypothetical protein
VGAMGGGMAGKRFNNALRKLSVIFKCGLAIYRLGGELYRRGAHAGRLESGGQVSDDIT